jgi:hypothetical protein
VEDKKVRRRWWVCVGRVRGWCETFHKSDDEAYKCLESELKESKQLNIVSDRKVYPTTSNLIKSSRKKGEVKVVDLLCPWCKLTNPIEEIVYHLGNIRARHYHCPSDRCSWNDYAFNKDDLLFEMWRMWKALAMKKSERPKLQVKSLQTRKKNKVYAKSSYQKSSHLITISISKYATLSDILVQMLKCCVRACGFPHGPGFKMLFLDTFNRLYYLRLHLRVFGQFEGREFINLVTKVLMKREKGVKMTMPQRRGLTVIKEPIEVDRKRLNLKRWIDDGNLKKKAGRPPKPKRDYYRPEPAKK